MINQNKFRIYKGLQWVLQYNHCEIGRYRTKKAAEIERDFFIQRYGM